MISSHTNKKSSGFTLIEMLTVIVIIGIIIAAGIPAFTTLVKSTGLSAGARNVSNSLSLARQYAITQRTNTRVLFADSNSAGCAPRMLYQSYCVVAKDRSSGSWQYTSKWEYLPLGVTFLIKPYTGPFGGGYDLDSLPHDGIPYPATGSPPVQFAYVEFKPTGASSQSADITLVEGYVESSAPVRTSANWANIGVDGLLGRVRVSRP